MNKEDLVQSSKHLLHEALGGLTTEPLTHDITLLKAGIATEHLLKGYLCTIHPSLITDARDLPSLLHACDRGDLTTRPVTLIKTIGLVEAYKRVYEILGKERLSLTPKDFQPIADARNGVAHLAVSTTDSMERLLSSIIKIADVLLAEMGEKSALFWADYAPVREKILQDDRKAHLVIIASLKSKALRVLEERFGEHDTEERQTAIKAASQFQRVQGQAAAQRQCPACQNQGWVGGDVTTTFPDDGEPQATIVTHAFKCSVCGFAVAGPLLTYFDHLYEDIALGPAATFTYADGTTHDDLWASIAAEQHTLDHLDDDDRRRWEEDLQLRAQGHEE
ncbi:hypothetical protein [Streptomyces sp. NPDC016845]|uniref:hypothetical protein n=1 Tax=Streptomyces sp. NPDC016845 TaxID=3364972 RepID=UPI0037B601C7